MQRPDHRSTFNAPGTALQNYPHIPPLSTFSNLQLSYFYPGSADACLARILGYFVEVISGMPFDTFLKKRLFDPLGMNDTSFYLPEDKAKRLVPVQHKSDDGKWLRYPKTLVGCSVC